MEEQSAQLRPGEDGYGDIPERQLPKGSDRENPAIGANEEEIWHRIV